MKTNNAGALPTEEKQKTEEDKASLAQKYTKHYLSHKLSDIPGSRSKSNTTVFDRIVNNHHKFHKGDYHDYNKDLKQAAYLIVHQSAIQYIKNNKYSSKFDFCVFVSVNLKFKLKNYIYNLNLKRLGGSLPDSQEARKLYYILPKSKNYRTNLSKGIKGREVRNNFISNDGYKKLSSDTGININKIKESDLALTNYTISGDKKLGVFSKGCIFDLIPEDNSSLEDKYAHKELLKKINKIKKEFLNTLSLRDRNILSSIKFEENKSIPDLSKKYGLSYERIRQISIDKYKELVNKLKKNLEY